LDFDAVDGIVINESAPPPSVQGVGTGIAILVGQFERGLPGLADTSGTGDIFEKYGKNYAYSGLVATLNKKFSLLRIARVVASGAVQASRAFVATATPIITFSAAQGKGAFGNGIKVTIAAGTTSGKKYTITDTNVGAVLPQEVYDNVLVANLAVSNVFAASKLVTAVVNSSASEPDNIAATALASGSDGSVADSDYQTAIDLCAVQGAGNILFLDAYTATRRAALKQHAVDTQDKMVIIANVAGTSASAVEADAATYRDVDGRIIYAFPFVQTVVNGSNTLVCPASFYASILSQTAPSVDPADVDNIQYLQGINGIELMLSRTDYIALMNAGVSAFEYDSDVGYKVRSGVVTQIVNSSKVLVSRRRMTDYLTNSIGRFLKLYQNGPNARAKRDAVKAAMLDFIARNEKEGILPKDSEVKSGKAKLVDTESANTDASIAAGMFTILYKQRIFSSMRFIVLQAEIGQSVLVTEV
jgi:hypothetical protein